MTPDCRILAIASWLFGFGTAGLLTVAVLVRLSAKARARIVDLVLDKPNAR